MYGNYNTGYGMNPYQQQLAQNRLNQMEQQYNVGTYQPNNYQMQNTQQMGTQMQVIKGRPVSSYDEAKASMIDLDGTLFVFTDIANHCIYTKQILLDGSAELKTYVLQEQKQNETKRSGELNEGYVLTKFVRSAMKQYREWEEETKKLYEAVCCVLWEKGLVVDYNLMMCYLEDVQHELKKIYRLCEELNGTGYDLLYIVEIQKQIHVEYKDKMRKLKVQE